MTTYVAILAGGSGTRFWPASTRDLPKQMLPLTGGAPLLRETVDRLAGFAPPERILVVTGARHTESVRRLLPELVPDAVLSEPRARNTSAACALAAHRALRDDADATVVTLSADHVISPASEFRDALAAAAARADAAGTLITLGLTPTFPATGLGWIEKGPAAAEVLGHAVHAIASFVEKPDRARAEVFLAQGLHLWNLGMFAWRADVFLAELAAHAPGVAEPLASISAALGTDDEGAALATAFDACESISVDYGVLERSDRVECVPCSFSWDDLGSFEAIARHVSASDDGHHSIGEIVSIDAENCVSWCEDGGLVALLGVKDLIVVNANGVTLVAPRWRSEEVKKMVARLEAEGREAFL